MTQLQHSSEHHLGVLLAGILNTVPLERDPRTVCILVDGQARCAVLTAAEWAWDLHSANEKLLPQPLHPGG